MPSTVDSSQLLKALSKLNKRLTEIVERDFPVLSDEQLNWKERAEKWSIAECLQHLNFVSDYHFANTAAAIAYAKAKHSKPQKTFSRGWLGHRMVGSVRLGSDNQIKSKAESPPKYRPDLQSNSELNAQQVLEKFLTYQKQLDQMILDAQGINIQATKVPIAFFGLVRIRLGDALKVLVYHNERHIVQAQRIIYHDYFPGNSPLDFQNIEDPD